MILAIRIAGIALMVLSVGIMGVWYWWPVHNPDIGRILWFSVGELVLPLAVVLFAAGIVVTALASIMKGD